VVWVIGVDVELVMDVDDVYFKSVLLNVLFLLAFKGLLYDFVFQHDSRVLLSRLLLLSLGHERR
jgi:hypothetical protein